jgi:hypothetical protein
VVGTYNIRKEFVVSFLPVVICIFAYIITEIKDITAEVLIGG